MHRRHPRLLRLWQRYVAWSVTLDGKLTWWASDDIHVRERKLDSEVLLPKWAWRPYCWIYGHEPHYSECVTCSQPLA